MAQEGPRLAAVMFAGIMGCTALAQADGALMQQAEPRLGNLRDDPRFAELCRMVGTPP